MKYIIISFIYICKHAVREGINRNIIIIGLFRGQKLNDDIFKHSRHEKLKHEII